MDKRRLDERVYGDMPDRFDTFLERTLAQEPRKSRARKPRMVLVMALALLLVAFSAIAVAYRVGLLDLFGIGAVDPGRVQQAISQTVVQTGGEASLADFTVREVYYDGTFLRFIMDCEAKGDARLYSDLNVYYTEMEAEGEPVYDNRYDVNAVLNFEDTWGVHLYDAHSQEGLSLAANMFFPGPMPEHLEVEVEISIISLDTGEVAETTTLSFAVDQTAQTKEEHYPAQLDATLVAVEDVYIASTPFETIVTVAYKPQLKAFSGFRVISADGYITKEGLRQEYGTYGSRLFGADLSDRVMFILPFETTEQDTLALWVVNSDTAVEIDLRTGALSAVAVQIVSEGNNTRVERIGGSLQ